MISVLFILTVVVLLGIMALRNVTKPRITIDKLIDAGWKDEDIVTIVPDSSMQLS